MGISYIKCPNLVTNEFLEMFRKLHEMKLLKNKEFLALPDSIQSLVNEFLLTEFRAKRTEQLVDLVNISVNPDDFARVKLGFFGRETRITLTKDTSFKAYQLICTFKEMAKYPYLTKLFVREVKREDCNSICKASELNIPYSWSSNDVVKAVYFFDKI